MAESSSVNEVVVASSNTSKETRVAAVEKMYSMLKAGKGDISAQDMVHVPYLVLDFPLMVC